MMDIIPAIDLIDGKCVRLTKGDFAQKTIYNNDPLKVAKGFEDIGIKRLHIVDLDGANWAPLKNLVVLEKIARDTSMILDFGGGIKTTEAVKTVLDSGASMISVGSIPVKDPEVFLTWLTDFGAEKFLVGADVLQKKLRINGWKEYTQIDVFSFIDEMISKGIKDIFCTDIAKDGTMEGPAIGLYGELLAQFPSLHLIASGGISCYNDLIKLQETGCSGAIVGKAIYEGKITSIQLQQFLKNN